MKRIVLVPGRFSDYTMKFNNNPFCVEGWYILKDSQVDVRIGLVKKEKQRDEVKNFIKCQHHDG